MLNGDGNENSKKINRTNQQNKKNCTCSTLWCTFLCRCFALLKRETTRHVCVWRKCCGSQLFAKNFDFEFLFSFFHRRSFFTCWLLASLIFSLPLQNFHPSSSEIRLRGFFFSRLLFLCYPCHCRHQNLVEKMTPLLDVFFFLNVQVAMRFTAKTSGCLNAKSPSGLHVGVYGRTRVT